MILPEDVEFTDTNNGGGGGGFGGSTDPVSRPIAPVDRTGFGGGSTQPVRSRAVLGTFDPTGGTNVDPVMVDTPLLGGGSSGGGTSGNGSGSGSAGGTGGVSNMHMPGETWSLGPGQGCAPGYVQQQTADGRWTCIPQSDFDKIFRGDFSPLFPGKAPAGVAPVDPNSSVYVGGQLQGTAQQVADAGVPAPGSGVTTGGGASSGGGSSTGGQGSINTGSSTIDRLIDLVAAQYAGAGVKGGGSGFDGLVSGPLAVADEGAGTTKSGGSGALVFVILIVLAGLGYWYYKKHKKAG